jgi:hypothetical protein
MEDVFDAAWKASPTPSGNITVDAELATLIDVHGLGLLDESGQLRRLLLQACPDGRREVAAILAAMSADIPNRLRRADDDEKLPALLKECSQYLQDHGSFDAEWASWAVRAWAHALALPTIGLGAGTPTTALSPPGPAPSPPSSARSDARGRAPDTDASATKSPLTQPDSDVASSFARMRETAPSSTISLASGAMNIPRTQREPIVPEFDRPMQRATDDASRREPTFEGVPHDALAFADTMPFAQRLDEETAAPETSTADTVALRDADAGRRDRVDFDLPIDPEVDDVWPSQVAASTAEQRVDEADAVDETATNDEPKIEVDPRVGIDAEHPPLFVEPLFTDHDIQRIARSGPEATPHPQTSMFADRARPMEPEPIDAFAPTRQGFADDDEPTVRMPEAMAPSPWGHSEDTTPRRFRTPLLVGVVALVVALVVVFNLDALRRFVSPTTVASTARDGSSASGTVASSATTTATDRASGTPPAADTKVVIAPTDPVKTPDAPAAATTSPGATTSAPEPSTAPHAQEARATTEEPPKQSAAVDVPPSTKQTAPTTRTTTPPVIARVEIPRIDEGSPFSVTLRVAGDARDVASVERRIVESGGSWPRMAVVTRTSDVRRTGNSVVVPFRAMDAPAHATIAFTVIGRDGSRSEAKTATIALGSKAAAAPTVVTAAGCTASTCGTVIEAREVEPGVDTRATVYQVVVRLDDHATQAFTAPYRLQIGSRVRVAAGRVYPVVSNDR